MKSLTSFIAKLGTNPYWIAANAHFWFAAFIMLVAHGNLGVFGLSAVLAAWKEFYFDANMEVPVQTARDNWLDFAGYISGLVVGTLIALI